MKLAALGAILSVSSATAWAETSFDEYSEGVQRRPTQQLAESACDVDIQLRGAIATFEARHRIANPGPGALASSYQFDLPRGATLTGFSLRSGAFAEQALAIPGEVTAIDANARPVFGVDPSSGQGRLGDPARHDATDEGALGRRVFCGRDPLRVPRTAG